MKANTNPALPTILKNLYNAFVTINSTVTEIQAGFDEYPSHSPIIWKLKNKDFSSIPSLSNYFATPVETITDILHSPSVANFKLEFTNAIQGVELSTEYTYLEKQIELYVYPFVDQFASWPAFASDNITLGTLLDNILTVLCQFSFDGPLSAENYPINVPEIRLMQKLLEMGITPEENFYEELSSTWLCWVYEGPWDPFPLEHQSSNNPSFATSPIGKPVVQLQSIAGNDSGPLGCRLNAPLNAQQYASLPYCYEYFSNALYTFMTQEPSAYHQLATICASGGSSVPESTMATLWSGVRFLIPAAQRALPIYEQIYSSLKTLSAISSNQGVKQYDLSALRNAIAKMKALPSIITAHPSSSEFCECFTAASEFIGWDSN